MDNIQVIIFPEMFTDYAIRADGALLNVNNKLSKAGFFESIKLKFLVKKFVDFKTTLVKNPYCPLVISSEFADEIYQWSSEGSVLNVTGFSSQDADDGLFNFDPPKRDDDT